MARSRRIDTSPLTRGSWWGRIALLLSGPIASAALVQRGGRGSLALGLLVLVFPAVWAGLQLSTRSGLTRGWMTAATFGIMMFLPCAAFALGDLWRLAAGHWETAVVAGESSHCSGRYGCNRQYTVTLVGRPGLVDEDHQGQFAVGSSVRVLIDPAGIVRPSADGETDRLQWLMPAAVVGAVPLVAVAAAAFRRSRRVSVGEPPP